MTNPIEKHKLFTSYPTLPLIISNSNNNNNDGNNDDDHMNDNTMNSSPTTISDPLYYDLIIASDMVCCDSDAIGVTTVLKRYLHPNHGMAIFIVPNPYHRYGIATLISYLQKTQFHIFIRNISHSHFNSQSHSSILRDYNLNSKEDIHTILSHLSSSDSRYNLISSLCSQDDIEIQQENDYLTETLKEIDYFEWLLIIVLS